MQAERANMPNLKHVVTMKGAPAIADDMVMSWEEFLAKGDEVEKQAYLDRLESLDPKALATLIYTSGTTGPPKGVMLSNHNLAWTANVAAEIVAPSPADWSLSYLPLSHIAGADVHASRSDHHRLSGVLRRVDRSGAGEPQGSAANRLLRRAAHLGKVPCRHRVKLKDATGVKARAREMGHEGGLGDQQEAWRQQRLAISARE